MNLTSETRQSRWRNQHPSRYLAHLAVQQALKGGDLIKGPCEVCGRTHEETRIDAHHDDYRKPLAVRWLCRLHHVRHHTGGTDMFTRIDAA